MILLVFLLAGWVFSISLQQRRLRQRFTEVRELSETSFSSSMNPFAMSPEPRQRVSWSSQKRLQYLRALSEEARGDDSLRQELADAYGRISGIQLSLGDLTGSEKSLETQNLLLESLLTAHPEDPTLMHKLADSYGSLVNALKQDSNRRNEAGRFEISQTKLLTRLTLANPHDDDLQSQLAKLDLHRADELLKAGKPKDALPLTRQAVEIYCRRTLSRPGNVPGEIEYGRALMALGDTLGKGEMEYGLGDLPAGLAAYREAQTVLEHAHSQAPFNARGTLTLTSDHMYSASTLGRMNKQHAALAEVSLAIPLYESVYRQDSSNVDVLRNTFLGYLDRSHYETDFKSFTTAEQDCRRALSLSTIILAKMPQNFDAQSDVASVQSDLSELLFAAGKPSQAVEPARQALKGWTSLCIHNPNNFFYSLYTAITLQSLGNAELNSRRPDAARDTSPRVLPCLSIYKLKESYRPKWQPKSPRSKDN